MLYNITGFLDFLHNFKDLVSVLHQRIFADKAYV